MRGRLLQDADAKRYTGYLQVDGYAGYHQSYATLVVYGASTTQVYRSTKGAKSKQ